MLHRQPFEIRMIGSNPNDIHLELPHLPAEQQIRQTVLELGHHDQNLGPIGDIPDRPRHIEISRNRPKLPPQRINLQGRRRCNRNPMKHTSHEKPRADVIVEYGQLIDIAMMPLEKTNNGGDLACGART